MNPVKKLMSWVRGPGDPESVAKARQSVAEAQRLREDRATIRISQNTGPSELVGIQTNLAPTPDVLDPGSEGSHN
jgi:hypothetical protein